MIQVKQKKQSDLSVLLLHSRSSRLCALSVWLVTNNNLNFNHFVFAFFLRFAL